jgi:hypothetical protein
LLDGLHGNARRTLYVALYALFIAREYKGSGIIRIAV